MLNGLDNIEARRHVNRLCQAAQVSLVESGTEGYVGQACARDSHPGPDHTLPQSLTTTLPSAHRALGFVKCVIVGSADQTPTIHLPTGCVLAAELLGDGAHRAITAVYATLARSMCVGLAFVFAVAGSLMHPDKLFNTTCLRRR